MPESRAADLLGVLEDLHEYLRDLTLVGGWLPYVYANFLWGKPAARPVFTSDVDWGVSPAGARGARRTIFETLSALKYAERHPELGKSEPVVFYRANRTRLDFIAPTREAGAERLLGREVLLSRLEHFGFLLAHTVKIPIKRGAKKFSLRCPAPAAFVCHKCATFTDRDDRQKMAKDLYYAYFVLRHAPDAAALGLEMAGYKGAAEYKKAVANVREYFGGEGAPGCVLVAGEYGADPYIDDLAGDIRSRFNRLIGGDQETI